MADTLTQRAGAAASRSAARQQRLERRLFESAELHRLFPGDAAAGDAPSDAPLLFEFAPLRGDVAGAHRGSAGTRATAGLTAAVEDLRCRLAAADAAWRNAQRQALSREAALLRELLLDRDKRIADKDAVIGDLQSRLAAADAERQTMLRQLAALLSGQRHGRLRCAMQAFGRMLEALTDIAQPSFGPAQQRATSDAEAEMGPRARAEKALLEQIAQQHRRWVARDSAAHR